MKRNTIVQIETYQGFPVFIDLSNITNIQFSPNNSNYAFIHIKYNPKEIPTSDFSITIKIEDMKKYSIMFGKIMKARSCVQE